MAFYEQEVGVLISEDKLQARVRELAAEITRDYAGKDLTLICVLKGSAFFAIDLAKYIDLPVKLEFLGVSSYQGGTESTGEVRITTDVSKPMAGKHLLIIEDIIDTGLTMQFLLENLRARHPASLKVCTLLEKPSRARTKVDIDYKGFVIDDLFVVGYGLDFGEVYRNIPFIGVMKNK
ncbi:hypoxanthine phosphoribosyltransferase [Myxococcus xanthus DK 1622]|uniref:Hypoxanthine phosphoribosyltransferase n=3 Tax=Myxococcus TaxID=32 RepID=Q1D299_MYXXD|nr:MULTISPECIES: hypoxanthine phosphoribosyltransferase [Myxococcus]ABF93156.1 hypoxanthine phosphoribosyltransferase [Myxococcus xanthus DK 1622]NOJ54426.1 hypoxanthine phosphoribosyltransferase [Myxococcus xanthus]NOJ80155.1 hypoxanthine phosphoribosyltransferase [Myxococcus xanthus]NOJ90936.1 hypoxanthine phosphoribosyltransferase [Myxococcus xanthus]QDE91775.1 hypoxanthine phosphoribosyltransferase [Myxococcus xanthus]